VLFNSVASGKGIVGRQGVGTQGYVVARRREPRSIVGDLDFPALEHILESIAVISMQTVEHISGSGHRLALTQRIAPPDDVLESAFEFGEPALHLLFDSLMLSKRALGHAIASPLSARTQVVRVAARPHAADGHGGRGLPSLPRERRERRPR